jgi:hypothetical protein
LWQILLLVLRREVVARLKDNKGRNSLTFGVDALYDCCLLSIAWLDCLWPSLSLRSCNNCSCRYLAHHKASLVEVIGVVVLDAILGFDIGYEAELALDYLRILAEGSLVVILLIKLYYKL